MKARASPRYRPARRRSRPTWPMRLATAPSPQPLAGGLLRSGTPIRHISIPPRTQRRSRQRCGASSARSAAPRFEKPRSGRQDAQHGAMAPDRLSGLRDRAVLLLGFAGAFRRLDLVALDVADVAEAKTGLLVTIRRSKTDQEGEGATIAIAMATSPALPRHCGNGSMPPVSRLGQSFVRSTRLAQ